MAIALWQATTDDQERFRRLYDLYSYDFSEIYQLDVDDTGSYGSDDLAGCWVESWRIPFLFRVDGKLGGFAIVDHRNHLTDDTDVWDMAEFFVLRKYRRRGIGRHVAGRLFAMFPGQWEVRQAAKNIGAQAFWRRVIADYTHSRFTEVIVHGERWHGPVQRFESRVLLSSQHEWS
ncbi:MAG TPA: GNAT family N-acetyltransferase [Ktedonobacterales bacterium]|nr:GNAT family N-acetyltransferase [Ktedonobacterales bacterium]